MRFTTVEINVNKKHKGREKKSRFILSATRINMCYLLGAKKKEMFTRIMYWIPNVKKWVVVL